MSSIEDKRLDGNNFNNLAGAHATPVQSEEAPKTPNVWNLCKPCGGDENPNDEVPELI